MGRFNNILDMKKQVPTISELSKLAVVQVKDNLGIDIYKYDNDEIVQRVSNIVFVQKRAFNQVIVMTTLALALFIGGFFVLSLETFGYFIYSVFGLTLYLIIGVLAGIIRTVLLVKQDLLSVTKYAVSVLNLIAQDLGSLNLQDNENLKNPFTSIFEAVLVGLVQPKIVAGLVSKPFIGPKVQSAVDNTFGYLIKKFREQEDKANIVAAAVKTQTSAVTLVERLRTIVNPFIGRLEAGFTTSFRFITLPLYTLTALFSSILLLMLWLLG
jgi:hypothetical protein